MKNTLKVWLGLLLAAWLSMDKPAETLSSLQTHDTFDYIYTLPNEGTLAAPLRFAKAITTQPLLRLKQQPYATASFLKVGVPNGETIEVLAEVAMDSTETTNGRWYRIRYGFVEGYVEEKTLIFQ